MGRVLEQPPFQHGTREMLPKISNATMSSLSLSLDIMCEGFSSRIGWKGALDANPVAGTPVANEVMPIDHCRKTPASAGAWISAGPGERGSCRARVQPLMVAGSPSRPRLSGAGALAATSQQRIGQKLRAAQQYAHNRHARADFAWETFLDAFIRGVFKQITN